MPESPKIIPMDPQEIGQRIAAERKARGLTQAALAAQLYVTRQAVSKWEAGVSHN